jgi:hypothetical protein
MTKNELGAECGTYCMGMGGADRVLMGKVEGKRPLGRCTCKWEDIKLNFTETGWKGMHLAQDRAKWLAPVMHNEPSCSVKYGQRILFSLAEEQLVSEGGRS